MLAAMSSGSGKTVMTCGLLLALQRRGISAEGFKCGPDYIDPMFHRRVLGIPSRNLDLYLQGEAGVLQTLQKQRAEFALLEGAMGFYDGVNGTAKASAWQVAAVTNTPVLLLLRPQGSSLTLAAQVRGMQTFRQPSHLAGILLTDCKPMLYAHLKPILERETGLPVLGFLPPMEEAKLESRHLGLLTAAEVEDFSRRFGAVAPHCTIAVARDAAFCFYYEDNLDALRAAGAKLRFFSPLTDTALPKADGLYLGGGYPELYAKALSENTSLRESIRAAVTGGLPTVAECGGFLYLQRSLATPKGTPFPMAGVFSGEGVPTGRLQRFGYAALTAETDSLLLRRGETLPVHEFHYWDCTENGEAFEACKPSGKRWRCGEASPTLYAAFPHLHFGGALPLAQRFTDAAEAYRKEKQP